ncbi:MAG: hypothetical protein VKK42_20675 [Lyngbya sp.]|nr:hypothetical protein [Lyngbya sp.]
MAENKTKKLFTDLSKEESSSINGGHYCDCYSYKKSSYHYKKSYDYDYDYDYHYYPAYYSGSPRYCY